MRWLLGATVLAIALQAAAVAQAASPQLVRVSPPQGGYSVLLPRGWRFADATYPSDHATHLWFDPRNALRKMVVVASGCVGCVSKNFDGRTPNPAGMLPANATHVHRISPYVLSFTTQWSGDPYDPYPDSGLVIVTHKAGRITGSIRVELWLPASQHALTTRILNSFRPAS